ncbi:MAG: aminotransferase class I/II-fold pyridoxal phosphate-dependent enzyme [Bacteroidales bacterium]|jgi:methionine aminotransferase|nr:aminotransferase class I/II-fold pyridoxal phosphate-dependent enzyme [Bacteroidales bacterium]
MIKEKLLNKGKDIYTVISDLVQGTDIINLAKISPDIPCSDKLTELAIKYIKEKSVEYSHPNGLLALREGIAKNIKQRYGLNKSAINEITITAGATQAMYTAISTFVNEGDEVVLFEPAFNSYIPAIESNGGRPVFVQRKQPDYHIDWEAVLKLINTRTKLIIVNTPHNPTGAIFNEEDIVQLKKITSGTKINVISDEVFEHMVFDGQKHISVLSDEKLAERCIVISSFGITFNVPGWKIGYYVSSEELMSKIRKKQHFQINTINTPFQYALADYLKEGVDYNITNKQFEKKKQFVNDILKDSRFKIIPTKGTFYQLLDYSEISDEKDTEFARRIMDEYGVALFPLSVFYHDSIDNKILGFSFARNNKILTKAANQLLKV